VVVALVAIFVVAARVNERKQILRDTEAQEYAAKLEQEKEAAEEKKKAAEETRAAQEKAQFETLPPETKARIAFAKIMTVAYQKENFIVVSATGENFDTLEVSSALIPNDSSTLDAAREILGPDFMHSIRGLKFKRVFIKNSDSRYSESYAVE